MRHTTQFWLRHGIALLVAVTLPTVVHARTGPPSAASASPASPAAPINGGSRTLVAVRVGQGFSLAGVAALDASQRTATSHASSTPIADSVSRHVNNTGGQSTQRRSDSLLNGALIGAGVAVGAGLAFCTAMEPWENCRDDYGPLLRIAAVGAGVGAVIDALIRQRGPARTALTARPVITSRARGVQVSARF